VTVGVITRSCFLPRAVSAGDASGTLHVLEVPANMRRKITNEKGLFLAFLEREERRVA
jgi:hypothetical protein